MNWQPMSSAPTTRTLLIYNGPKSRYRICVAKYHQVFGWQSSPGGWPCTPKAWAFLPDEPEGIQG